MSTENHSNSSVEDEKDDSGIEQDQSWIYIRIAVEDLHLQKVLKFNLDQTVWNAKQKVLQVLVRELDDGINFGLYLPPCNGRAGKFLDESRCLREYPLNGPVGYLEFKYKRRVYKSLTVIHKTLHSKMNIKKFIDSIKTNQVSKVVRCLEKGLDPNFHVTDDETPLTCACVDLLEPRSMIMALVNGGAHLDFRVRRAALTPLHKAAIHCRKQAIITLLELGASPNVFDEKGLTPLYHSILNKHVDLIHESALCCQLLLQDHSIVNCHDDYLSTELHQACRLGLVQHVEHLLFYRANINSSNVAGNTPLHICATTNQEACARVLLFRGADPTIVNKSNQTAYELALVSQNNVVASIIQTHKSEHVVPFREIPLMNSRRRSIYFEKDRQRTRSTSQTPSSIYLCNRSQSLPKLNGINLLQSGTSEQQNSSNHENDYHVRPSSRSSSPKSFSVHSDHGLGSECNSHHSSHSPNETPSNYSCQRKRLYAAAPGRKCMCIKSYKTNVPGELALHKGEIVEILSVGEQGFLEGRCQDRQGWFPSNVVQDIHVFKNSEVNHDDTIVISRDALSALIVNNDMFSPRTVVLQRGKKGFGFVLRGCRVVGTLFQPTPSFPALQFLDSIEKGSNADKAGLRQNDYVLEINGINVISMAHEECVQLIKRAGDTLALKVVTANASTVNNGTQANHFQSLPYRRKALLSLTKSSKKSLSSFYQSSPLPSQTESLTLQRKEHQSILDDLDRTLAEYEYGSLVVSSSHHSEECSSAVKRLNESTFSGSASIRSKTKPLVPERDSSLYECFTNSHNSQIYQTFRPSVRGLPSANSVPNLTLTNSFRRNSNSSSNEADEELSLSSMNSNQLVTTSMNVSEDNGIGIYMTPSLSMSTSNMSTFKTTTATAPPAKPSEVKRRSNQRKQQIYATVQPTINGDSTKFIENETQVMPIVVMPPPPPPPLPNDLDLKKVSISSNSTKSAQSSTTDFQRQIEQAKFRLRKTNDETLPEQIEISSKSMNLARQKSQHPSGLPMGTHRPSAAYNFCESRNVVIEDRVVMTSGFPPPPSPTTLHRSSTNRSSPVVDPRNDVNFSSVIAQRAAASKARRHEQLTELEQQHSNGLPPATTFFNNHVTTTRLTSPFHLNQAASSQRFSTTANQLLENLKRRADHLSVNLVFADKSAK